jgi:DNA invertase Pin-like site-specific DNA recombinase
MSTLPTAADANEVVDAREDHQEGSKRALLYLRVSTKEQAMRSGDPEGYSLPTQREACLRKAQSLGADVIDEYLDKDTGTMVDKRPAMQKLLARVAKERDFDFVIVHKLDRLARNRLDDANMTVTLEAAGATLVSCVEGIDQSPSGRLLHGMLASVNEYYSRNLSDEIKRKTLQKAKNGGTPFLAPIGYLNKRDLSGGRDDRWIELDPERAPLITWAFEAYATGLWSLNSLQAELTARGLTTRATAKKPAKELHVSLLQRILVRPYYIGIVEYRGVQYEGSHKPLITPEVFFKVQEVLAAHNTAGERSWRHQHYLKGSVFCSDCDSRLTLDFASGNGGRYCYFVCLGRKRGLKCTQKALQTEAVEEALARHWRGVKVKQSAKDGIRRVLTEDLDDERAEADTDRRVQERRIQSLKDERQKLLDGYYAGAIPLDMLKTEQDRIGRGLASAETRLGKLATTFDQVEEVITRAIAWADQLHLAYQAASEQVRRLFNQAIFKQVFIGADGVAWVEYTDGFAELLEDGTEQEVAQDGVVEMAGLISVGPTGNDKRPGRRARTYRRSSCDQGWNVKRLVELEGIEPSSAECGLPVLRPFPRGGPNAVLVPGHELLVTSFP